MATKRKPKSEPIMNAEPLHSAGVIVTHPERHITPGNASITWLVVMMAIIGAVGGFCTFIWWQKEDLAAQIEAPYIQDQGHMFTKFMRSMRERVLSKPTSLIPQGFAYEVPSLSMRLAVPAGWSAAHGTSANTPHTFYLSQAVIDGVEKNNSLIISRPDIRVQLESSLDNTFDAWLAAQMKGLDKATTKEVTLPGVKRAVLVQGQQQSTVLKGFDTFYPAPYAYYLSISQEKLDGSIVEYYVKAEAAATVIDYTNVAVPNPHPEENYPYITTEFKKTLDQIVTETKWN